MVRWVIVLILHGVDPLSYLSFQPVLHYWYNKGHDMCYPEIQGIMHIKEPLLLIGKVTHVKILTNLYFSKQENLSIIVYNFLKY